MTSTNSQTTAELCTVLDRVQAAGHDDGSVTVADVQHIAGDRGSGPLLLVPGLLAVSPLSGIPSVPTIIGVIVLLVSVQIVLGRRHIWLPQKIRDAGLSARKVDKAIAYLRPVAGRIDRFATRRWAWMTSRIAVRLASLVCVLIALAMPVMEVIPFSSSVAGLVITVFGLALMTGDGLMLLSVFVLFVAGLGLAVPLIW
ncbi:exopolysaccharide biosynthesis protein [Rhizobium halophytocola]|uniref:Exopolysaccharide biosynthesis protein n=1 Tax=Rhizobium halophytocola TaxID=735519 RepID=A0ABS4E3L9_9HYPH|nr:exopolysaccharide biosynthesis protein [Rhizobium halophytocola]MBP1852535.1 hypothetical protein [Rhizobium halophytocola]